MAVLLASVSALSFFQRILQTAGGVGGLKGESGHVKAFESFTAPVMRSRLFGLTDGAL